jgi:protein-tyrosine phosphatase
MKKIQIIDKKIQIINNDTSDLKKTEKHYAKQITKQDFDRFDLIVAFDEYNVRNLKSMFKDLPKIVKLNEKDVDDPWYKRNFDKAYEEIYQGCIQLIKKYDL